MIIPSALENNRFFVSFTRWLDGVISDLEWFSAESHSVFLQLCDSPLQPFHHFAESGIIPQGAKTRIEARDAIVNPSRANCLI